MKTFFKSFVVSILIFSGCSSESQLIKTYEILLEPVKEQNLTSYYVSGLPIGASSIKNFNIIFNLQPALISGDDCLRLWFFIQNNSDQEVLFEPTKEFKLIYSEKNKSDFQTIPESPLEILKSLENSKQIDMIVQTIGSALKSAGTSINRENVNTNTEDSELEIKINNIENWYDLYSESINQGILRKNTLFPKQSVNGYIYFKLPIKYKPKEWGITSIRIEDGTMEFIDIKNYKINLIGQKLLISSNIKFIQVVGE